MMKRKKPRSAIPSPSSFTVRIPRCERRGRNSLIRACGNAGAAIIGGVGVSLGCGGMMSSDFIGCVAHPSRHFYRNAESIGFQRGALYGVLFPDSDAAFDAMLVAGYSHVMRSMRESRYGFFGSMRRSMRKAIKRGDLSVEGVRAYYDSLTAAGVFIGLRTPLQREKRFVQNADYWVKFDLPRISRKTASLPCVFESFLALK